MNDRFTTETKDGVTTIRILQAPPFRDLLKIIDDVAAVGVTDRRLWDITQDFDYNSEEIRALAERGRQLWPGPSKVAYLVGNELAFGLLRMFETYREQEQYETKVFRSEEEALAWLRKGEL